LGTATFVVSRVGYLCVLAAWGYFKKAALYKSPIIIKETVWFPD